MKNFVVMFLTLCLLMLTACGTTAPVTDTLPPAGDTATENGTTADGSNDGENDGTGDGGTVPDDDTPGTAPEAPDMTPDVPAEPEPETPAEPVVVKDVLVRSNTDSLTVRTGPGTGYTALGYLDKNDMAEYRGKTSGWYQIVFKRRTAYVSAAYATTVEFEKGSDTIERILSEGKQLLGIPYVLGAQRYHWGNGVKNTNFTGDSFDCSSLTQYIYKIAAGVNLGVTTRDQVVQGTAVGKNNLRRGDLMFFTNEVRVNKTGVERIGHVAVYLGDNYILHTASDHAVIEPISNKRWSYYETSRRFV